MQENAIFAEGDYVIVRHAVELLFNDGCTEAKEFLTQKRNESSLLIAASSFVDFLSSLLTLEENDINGAICSLKETQRFCESQRNQLRQKKCDEQQNLEYLMNEILSTDAELYMAVLTILKQGIKDYVKGAFMIRKAWKQYKKSYEKVIKMGGSFLNCTVNNAETDSCQTESPSPEPLLKNPNEQNQNCTLIRDACKTLGNNSFAVTEVRAAIAFGYGLFNLIVSLIPPRILQVIQVFGFAANQDLGLMCLNYVCNSQDVKAELSRLGLTWFHAIIRPIYALDDDDIESSLKEASQLLESLQPKLLLSPVALYFKGLLFRCKGNLSEATKMIELALEKPLSHKEFLMFCDYEIGWCNLLEMKWDLAIDSFKRVNDGAVWSQCFYSYLIGALLGLQGNATEALVHLRYVPSLVKRKTPLGNFLTRKANWYNQSPPHQVEYLLLVLEIIYLWDSLPTCSVVTLSCLLNELNQPVKDEFVPMKLFLTGYILQRLGQLTRSVECYKEAISKADHVILDAHVKPFALYELALVCAKVSQFNKGREFLRKAREISGGYDFENRLKLKIDIAMKTFEEKSRELESRDTS